jgi:hypothetical protein
VQFGEKSKTIILPKIVQHIVSFIIFTAWPGLLYRALAMPNGYRMVARSSRRGRRKAVSSERMPSASDLLPFC